LGDYVREGKNKYNNKRSKSSGRCENAKFECIRSTVSRYERKKMGEL
jgi:hypothetical protein